MKAKWLVPAILFAVICGGLGLWYYGPTRQAESPSPAPPVLRFSSEGQMVTFDPHLQNESATWSILCNIYEGLVRFGANLKVESSLASSWSNPDPLHWRFLLRTGVRFHDGRPLTVEDVVYSIQRAAFYEKSAISSQLSSIRAVTSPQPGTILVETRYPDPVLLNKLTFAFILPRHEVFEYPSIASQPTGTGPYRLDHWLTDTSFLIRQFDGYWGRRGIFPLVQIHSQPDEETRLADLLAGKVDLARGFHWEQYSRIRSNPKFQTASSSSLAVMFLGCQVGPAKSENGVAIENPLAHRAVRQAIHLTLDRNMMVQKTYRGLGQPATQFVTSEVFGFDPQLAIPRRDPELARRLLAESGYPAGFQLELYLSRNLRAMGEVVQENLAAIGIRVRLRFQPWREIYQLLTSDAPPRAFIFGFSCSSGDISDFLDSCLHTRLREGGNLMGELNPTGYNNPQVDHWIEESRQMMNLQERKELLRQINQTALNDLPFIPLTSNPRIFGFVAGLDWPMRADARVYLNEVIWKPEPQGRRTGEH